MIIKIGENLYELYDINKKELTEATEKKVKFMLKTASQTIDIAREYAEYLRAQPEDKIKMYEKLLKKNGLYIYFNKLEDHDEVIVL